MSDDDVLYDSVPTLEDERNEATEDRLMHCSSSSNVAPNEGFVCREQQRGSAVQTSATSSLSKEPSSETGSGPLVCVIPDAIRPVVNPLADIEEEGEYVALAAVASRCTVGTDWPSSNSDDCPPTDPFAADTAVTAVIGDSWTSQEYSAVGRPVMTLEPSPAGNSAVGRGDSRSHTPSPTFDEEPIYEPVAIESDSSTVPRAADVDQQSVVSLSGEHDDDQVWSDSEFEQVPGRTAACAMPRSKSTTSAQGEASFLERFTSRLSFRSQKQVVIAEKFTFNRERHPLPFLPSPPAGLSETQVKRRYVVDSIITIENSYVNSLSRLKQCYMIPLLLNSDIVSAEKVNSMFSYIEDILDCHLMFQVALEESTRNWDRDEKIGGQFVSCFSKSMVLDCYTGYVNNFLVSTGLIRRLSRERSVFESFLLERQRCSPDKMDVFGLMLKPVQRFPQYILQIKDLIKYTPREHVDYIDMLQALTTVENIAHELNERKRLSEVKLAAKVMLEKLNIKPFGQGNYLIRQDDVELVEYGTDGEVLRQKPNRLLLCSDLLVCLKIDSDNKEKCHLKWFVPISKVGYHDACKPTLGVTTNESNGGLVASSATAGVGQADDSTCANLERLQRELNDLRQDEDLLHQIYLLVSGLRQTYKGLAAEDIESHVSVVTRGIALRHDQLKMLDSCTIQLSLPPTGVPTARAKTKRIFQLLSPEVKQDWVLDFRAAKLAEEPHNKPGWKGDVALLKHPLLIKSLQVDVTRDAFQVYCAAPIFLTSTVGGVGLQYLWLCGGRDGFGQVTIVSLHASQPYVVESFKAFDAPITAVSRAPSSFHSEDDQMWMVSGHTVLVYGLRRGQQCSAGAIRTFTVQSSIITMRNIGFFMFVALDDGLLQKYSVRKGSPLYANPQVCRLDGSNPVSCIVPVDKNKLFCAVKTSLYVVSTQSEISVTENHELSCAKSCIQHVVKIGHGLWVSFFDDPRLRLYHVDTYEFLQEVDVESAVHKLLPDVSREQPVFVSAMTATQGLLWIGTDTGHILTIPIPVLQGVPSISGRMSVSLNGHCSPVHFLMPVTCSLTSAPRLPSEAEHKVVPAEQRVSSDSTSATEANLVRRSSADDRPADSSASSSTASVAGDSGLSSAPPKSSRSMNNSWKSDLLPRNVDLKPPKSTGSFQSLVPKSSKGKRPKLFQRRKSTEPTAPRDGHKQQGSPKDELTQSLSSSPDDSRASEALVAKVAQDTVLRSMYSSLMKLDDFDNDNVRASSDLVNRLVPVNAMLGRKRVVRASVHRSSLATASPATATRGSMLDLRSGQQGWNLVARRAQSTWALNDDQPYSALKPRYSLANVRTAPDCILQEDLQFQDDPLYDDVAHDELENSDPIQDELMNESLYLLDDALPSEDSGVLSQGEGAPSTAAATAQAVADDLDVDVPIEGTVETNYLKTILVISGGEGYLNYSLRVREGQDEATLLLWQHTQTVMPLAADTRT